MIKAMEKRVRNRVEHRMLWIKRVSVGYDSHIDRRQGMQYHVMLVAIK
jgi:ribosomal protein L20